MLGEAESVYPPAINPPNTSPEAPYPNAVFPSAPVPVDNPLICLSKALDANSAAIRFIVWLKLVSNPAKKLANSDCKFLAACIPNCSTLRNELSATFSVFLVPLVLLLTLYCMLQDLIHLSRDSLVLRLFR